MSNIRTVGRHMKLGVFQKIPISMDITRFVTTKIFVPFTCPIVNNEYDNLAYQAEQWAIKNLRYGLDTFWGAPEYWLLPEETLEAYKKNAPVDCEDGANLILSFLLSLGVPRDRVWCTGGPVTPNTGHAYVCYVRDNDGAVIVLDWCYRAKYTSLNTRTTYQDDDDYGMPWFSWNDQTTWYDGGPKLFGRLGKES